MCLRQRKTICFVSSCRTFALLYDELVEIWQSLMRKCHWLTSDRAGAQLHLNSPPENKLSGRWKPKVPWWFKENKHRLRWNNEGHHPARASTPPAVWHLLAEPPKVNSKWRYSSWAPPLKKKYIYIFLLKKKGFVWVIACVTLMTLYSNYILASRSKKKNHILISKKQFLSETANMK